MRTPASGRILTISIALLLALTAWCLWMDVNLWSALTRGQAPFAARTCTESVTQAGDAIVDCAGPERDVGKKLAVLAALMFGTGFLAARLVRENPRRHVVLLACLGTTWCFAMFLYSISRTMAAMEPWDATRHDIVIAWLVCCAVITAVSLLGAIVADRLVKRAQTAP